MNDVDRLRLYRAQLETDGTLVLSRENAVWVFEMAALGVASGERPETAPVRRPRNVVHLVLVRREARP
jgi:hypothetical protein